MAHGRLSLFGVGGWELGIGGVIPRKANALKASPSVSSAVVVARQELSWPLAVPAPPFMRPAGPILWLTISLCLSLVPER